MTAVRLVKEGGALIAPPTAARPPFETITWMDGASMHPVIPDRSLVFLGRRGEYHGDSVYCMPCDGAPGPICYAASDFQGRFRVWKTDGSLECWITIAERRADPWWPVVGYAHGIAGNFTNHIRQRYLDAERAAFEEMTGGRHV